MEEKPQIFIVHGGTTFKNREDYLDFLKNRSVSIEKKRKWRKQYLDEELGDDFKIIRPRMPLKENARYEDWKIHFERHIPHLEDNLILIGISLGGIFLAKYLSENEFPKKILSTYLIAPPFDNEGIEEDLVGGFELGEDLSKMEENCNNTTLIFSKDDEVVPISHASKYKEKLENSNFEIYESKNGHFRIPEFPEIVKMIREDLEMAN